MRTILSLRQYVEFSSSSYHACYVRNGLQGPFQYARLANKQCCNVASIIIRSAPAPVDHSFGVFFQCFLFLYHRITQHPIIIF